MTGDAQRVAGGSVRRRSLACLGDAAKITTWSNIPYFLFEAARPAGLLTDALDLMDPRYRMHRAIWNAMAPLRLERPGCYQYSRASVRRMWERVPQASREGELLSHFQLFPPLELAAKSGTTFCFYCDATLRQLSSAQALSGGKGRRTFRDALARERELYQAARFFIGMAKATSQAVVSEYGVPRERVFTVRPGANLDEAMVRGYLDGRGPSWRGALQGFDAAQPARLGFIGMDWRRKGLPRLYEAAKVLEARGRAVRLSIIGGCPPQMASDPLVEYHGVVSKSKDILKFLTIVDGFALGCLPSHREPLGISTLECLRLGVPVMGTRVGGIPDCVPADGGFLAEADATAEQIADLLEQHLFDAQAYRALAAGAEREMEQVTWARTVSLLQQILG